VAALATAKVIEWILTAAGWKPGTEPLSSRQLVSCCCCNAPSSAGTSCTRVVRRRSLCR